MSERVIVCRCEDITEDEVVEAIRQGATSLEEIKRHLRAGMGSCQGRTCGPLIQSILARELGRSPQSFAAWNKRPPLKPVPCEIYYGGDEE